MLGVVHIQNLIHDGVEHVGRKKERPINVFYEAKMAYKTKQEITS